MNTIRIVIDTNIALAGFLSFTTTERKLINYALQKKITLVGSDDTLAEFSRKLDENNHFKKVAKDFMFSKEKLIQSYRSLIRLIPIDDEFVSKRYCPDDPDDDTFVRVALSSKAEIIVTNDKHLFKINKNLGVRVIKPDPIINILRENLH